MERIQSLPERPARPLTLTEYVMLHSQDVSELKAVGYIADDAPTYDLVFFTIAITTGDDAKLTSAQLVDLIRSHRIGADAIANVLDGIPHTYIEIARWLGGTEQLALQFIALGVELDVFRLITPHVITHDADAVMLLARCGFLGAVANAFEIPA